MVILHQRMIVLLGAKTDPTSSSTSIRGLRLKKHHEPLLVAHLEQPAYVPRALIGTFSGTTGRIGFVLTGPRATAIKASTSRLSSKVALNNHAG
ncbi:MAG: hypothetical protein JAY64_05585 [Candidatus Thiodiazotropha weberae]|nr:hypothetical protein [Candidatus Thiodiazotropha lotti]